MAMGAEVAGFEGFGDCGAIGSVDDVGGGAKDALVIPDEVCMGDGLRVRRVVERRAFNCMILMIPFVPHPTAITSPQ